MNPKKQFSFSVLWSGVYSLIFNGFQTATLMDLCLAVGWVFLLFFVATYSRVFLFSVIPMVFITSSAIAYGERLINAPISRDVIASVFQTSWQEMLGVTGYSLTGWLVLGVVLSLACIWHLLSLRIYHAAPVKLVISLGFLMVFWIAAKTMFPPVYGNRMHWRHPYDYMEYALNYFKEVVAIDSYQKLDLSYWPAHQTKIPEEPPLVIALVIGEAARPDHFGVYGYARATTPLLQKERNLAVFNDVRACGTTTTVSVPCLMTRATEKNLFLAKTETSFINIFKKLGFYTSWISEQAKFNGINTAVASISNEAQLSVFQDNNLTMNIIQFKDFFFKTLSEADKASLIVYHMIGSHFPYQQWQSIDFPNYSPICLDVLPNECPREVLINTYDNTIVYTDYFLAKAIEALRNKNALLVYVSDHGEYLGEGGKYLHGQDTDDDELRKVPMIWWYSDQFVSLYADKVANLRQKSNDKLSHDNLFHSLLDCAGIESQAVDKSLSLCH